MISQHLSGIHSSEVNTLPPTEVKNFPSHKHGGVVACCSHYRVLLHALASQELELDECAVVVMGQM